MSLESRFFVCVYSLLEILYSGKFSPWKNFAKGSCKVFAEKIRQIYFHTYPLVLTSCNVQLNSNRRGEPGWIIESEDRLELLPLLPFIDHHACISKVTCIRG